MERYSSRPANRAFCVCGTIPWSVLGSAIGLATSVHPARFRNILDGHLLRGLWGVLQRKRRPVRLCLPAHDRVGDPYLLKSSRKPAVLDLDRLVDRFIGDACRHPPRTSHWPGRWKTADLYNREISASAALGFFLNWKILWLPLFGVFLIATVTLAFLVFHNRSRIRNARDVLDRFPLWIYAALISAAGAACALVNVACYREFIEGRYLFPLALLPWLVSAGLIWALYRPFPLLRRAFGLVPALVASLVAAGLAWPKDALTSNNSKAAARFVRHTGLIRSTLETARERCLGKPHPIVVLLSHDFNDLEPVVAVDKLLDYLTVPGPRYFLRHSYSLESAANDSQRFLWKLMEGAVASGRLKRADPSDLSKADFVIQFSASSSNTQTVPNLWPLYLHQD